MFFQSMIIFLRCKEGGRLRHVRFIQGIHIEARIFGTALSHPHQPVHPSRFLRCKGGGRDCGMCLSFKAYTSRYGRFCTPCPKSTSQLIHRVFCDAKKSEHCGMCVSFKAYTSRHGYFARLVPTPLANSSVAFFAMQKNKERYLFKA